MNVTAFSPQGTKPTDVLVWLAIASCSITVLTCAWKCFKGMCCRSNSEQQPLLNERIVIHVHDEGRSTPYTQVALDAVTPRVPSSAEKFSQLLDEEKKSRKEIRQQDEESFYPHWRQVAQMSLKSPAKLDQESAFLQGANPQ